ncbi:MAG: hypothetical protein ATN36_06145 [Epulopiscium sp. Nele67-Bin005]|nr:MAG: hypothetical protein ATN36_06145 [Epulopiscium sp. Nele67-Bin005]
MKKFKSTLLALTGSVIIASMALPTIAQLEMGSTLNHTESQLSILNENTETSPIEGIVNQEYAEVIQRAFERQTDELPEGIHFTTETGEVISYTLDEIGYDIVDYYGVILESGSLTEQVEGHASGISSVALEPSTTLAWYPTTNNQGFSIPAGSTVTVKFNTNTTGLLRIGLTNGTSDETKEQNPSVDIYQTNDSLSKVYATNLSSAFIQVSDCSISWNE